MIKISLKKQQINEIDKAQLKYLNIPDAGDQFSELFGGKQRILIPVRDIKDEQDFFNQSSPTLTSILMGFSKFLNAISTEDYKYSVDFGSGALKQTYSYAIPKGPKAGETITKEKFTPIAKVIDMIRNIAPGKKGDQPEYAKIFNILFPKINDQFTIFSTNPLEFYKFLITEINGIYKETAKKENLFSKSGLFSKNNDGYRSLEWNLGSALNIVQDNAPKYSMVISRKPIDILRMSDHPGMRSCHRPAGSLQGYKEYEDNMNNMYEGYDEEYGDQEDEEDEITELPGEYFNCAVHESRGNGAVAYFISNSNLKDITNLDDAEIFADPQRKIQGVIPVGRIRLRRYMFVPTRQEFLVPEESDYGTTKIRKFHVALLEWARQSQKDVLEAIKSKSNLSKDDFILIGGSYTDNPTQSLLKNLIPGISLKEIIGQDLKFDETMESPEEIVKFIVNLTRKSGNVIGYNNEKVKKAGNKYIISVDIIDNIYPKNTYGYVDRYSVEYKNFQKKINNINSQKALEIVKNKITPLFNKIKMGKVYGFATYNDPSYSKPKKIISGDYYIEISFAIENISDQKKLFDQIFTLKDELSAIASSNKEITKEILKNAMNQKPASIKKPAAENKLMENMRLLAGIIVR